MTHIIAKFIKHFLSYYLPVQKGLAANTIKSITGQTETETLPKSPPFAATEFDDFKLVLVS